MIRLLLPVSAALSLALAAPVSSTETNRWEGEIAAFETADRTNPPPKQAILFVGSSSIRMWKTLATDFPGHPVINRGFGGSQIADSTAFAGRIVIPHKPRMVVLYAGDNDIAAGKTPGQVLSDFKAFVARVRAQLPETRFAFLAIKPSVARWQKIEKIQEANRLVKEHCATDPKLAYIDVFTPMLGADGKPRTELLVNDGLHLSEAGYAVWTATVRPFLDAK